MVKPLFKPNSGPLNVAALFSGNASGVRYLVKQKSLSNQPFKISVAVTDQPGASGIDFCKKAGIPVHVLTMTNPSSSKKRNRQRYFADLVKKIKRFQPQLILLSGFMKIVTEPLLTKFEGRIINVHPADLTLTQNGERKFTGDDAVYDAVVAHEKHLRSTVHLINEQIDEGPIITISKKFPVQSDLVKTLQKENPAKIRNYVEAFQEWMKWKGDGPALYKTVELFYDGRVAYDGSKVLIKQEQRFLPGYHDMQAGSAVLSS